MNLNTAKISCKQLILSKGKERIVGFEKAEETQIPFDRVQLKLWTYCHLHHWYQMQSLQGKEIFNLKRPIQVEIYWNDKLEMSLTQKRVTKDTVIRQNEDVPIQLLNCTYILVTYRENNIKRLSSNKQKNKLISESANLDSIFNAVEYFSNDRFKYGTPIIYTGMTN